MKLLLVDDDLDFVDVLQSVLTQIPRIELTIAKSRKTGIEAISEISFDLVVCDLKLPSSDGALDLNFSHGQAVYRHLMDVTPGTPLIVFTGFEERPVLRELLDAKREADFLGTRKPIGMVQFFLKTEMTDFINLVKDLVSQFNALDDIEILADGGPVTLAHSERRALQVYARRLDGHILNISEIGGGHTETKTLRVLVSGATGPKSTVVAKMGPIPLVQDEKDRFETNVAPSLTRIGSHVEIAGTVMDGAGSHGAIFYTLDAAFDRSAFGFLADSPADASELVSKLRNSMGPWLDGSGPERVLVKQVRQGLISDDSLIRVHKYLSELPLENFENRQVQTRRCCQHGDLHGLNILVNRDGDPVLIDFGQVGFATASLDAVVLELSLLFQPTASLLRGSWPTLEQANNWVDLDTYVANCPCSEFVRACRAWAYDVAAGHREVFVNLYAYSVRQLKYEDTDKALATSLIAGAIKAFEEN